MREMLILLLLVRDSSGFWCWKAAGSGGRRSRIAVFLVVGAFSAG